MNKGRLEINFSAMFESLKKAFVPTIYRGGSSNDIIPANVSMGEMAMLSRIAGVKEREFIESRFGVPIHKFADMRSYLSTGHQKVWATYRACKLISAVIMTADFRMMSESGEDMLEVPYNPNDPDTIRLANGGFLRKPNPYDSWEEMVEMLVFHLELVGRGFWLKDEVDLKGRPTALYPLLPQYVKIVPGQYDNIDHFVYSVNGKEKKLAPDEVIHFKATNPVSLIEGMGSIEPSQGIYNNFINREVLEENFLSRGANLSGVLTREDADDNDFDEEEWEKFKKKFNLDYAGKGNAGKLAFLNGKWSYHKLGMTMDEMQALEREKWNVEQIFLNHGVPLSVAGIEGAANYATARQDEINFRRYKVVPLIDLIVGRLNADGFIQSNNQNNVLSYELSGLIDVGQVVEDYAPLVEMGAMTRNEIREAVGLPVIDDPMLDIFTIDTNVIPLDMSGVGNPSDDLIEKHTAYTLGNGRGRRRIIRHDNDLTPVKASRKRTRKKRHVQTQEA